jgi:hypothetical protein
MSVISRVTVVPSRLIALANTLDLLGGRADRAELAALMFPEALRRSAGTTGTSDEVGPSAMAEELIKEALALGLVEAHGAAVALADDGKAFRRDPRAWLHDVLTDPTRGPERGQPDVSLALVWLLIQDPLHGLSWQVNHGDSIRAVFGGRAGISNLADFQQLFHWARYLGYCWWTRDSAGTRVVPDPYAAVSAAIAGSLIPVGTRMPVREFVKHLGAACPVLEGGAVREALSQGLDPVDVGGLGPGHFSSSTGLALERMALDGLLAIESASDGEFLLAGPPATTSTRISHVTVTRGAA